VTSVLLVDGLPGQNKGEIAILEGMIESFKTLGDVRVAVFTNRIRADAPRYPAGVQAVDATRTLPFHNEARSQKKSFRLFWSLVFWAQHICFAALHIVFGSRATSIMKAEIWKAYQDSDVIIEGHDGAFGIAGGKAGLPLYFYLMYLPVFARLLRKRVAFYGGSVDKPGRFSIFYGLLFRSVLNRMDLITLRENKTHQYLCEIGVRKERMFVTADLSFLLKPDMRRAEEIMAIEGITEAKRPLIGITVTREIASGFGEGERSYRKHVEILGKFIDEAAVKLGATFVFVPHCIGFDRDLDDRVVAGDVLSRCRMQDRVKVITNEYGAAELRGLIGRFDLFIGERMHSVISAMCMGVPAIAVVTSFDQRADIIDMLGQGGAICQAEKLTAETLMLKVESVWSKREEIRKSLLSQMETARAQATRNGELLKEVIDPRKAEK